MDIPEETRAALDALLTKLRPAAPSAKWVRVAGMHITLKFIGEVPEDKVAPIIAALKPIRVTSDVEMKFRGVGFFPNERRPRVFWAGIEATPNLAQLAAAVESALTPLGVEREQREFHPHLTLARFDPPKPAPELQKALAEMGALDFGGTRSGEFHLYRSQLKRGGAEYTKMATFSFVEQS